MYLMPKCLSRRMSWPRSVSMALALESDQKHDTGRGSDCKEGQGGRAGGTRVRCGLGGLGLRARQCGCAVCVRVTIEELAHLRLHRLCQDLVHDGGPRGDS